MREHQEFIKIGGNRPCGGPDEVKIRQMWTSERRPITVLNAYGWLGPVLHRVIE